MKYTLWRLALPVVLLTVALAANAVMYKCTDANGKVTFSDKACRKQRQEVVKERATSGPDDSSRPETSASPKLERIKPLASGRKVTGSSPLAIAYMKFVHAVKSCDRNELLNSMPGRFTQAIAAAKDGDPELKEGCRNLEMFLHHDFKDATEVIEGDTGKIQWMRVETTTDRSGPQTFRWAHTENFVKVNGVWKLSGRAGPAK